MNGYCVKCRTKRQMKAAKKVTKNGRSYMLGKCSKCSTKMAKFV